MFQSFYQTNSCLLLLHLCIEHCRRLLLYQGESLAVLVECPAMPVTMAVIVTVSVVLTASVWQALEVEWAAHAIVLTCLAAKVHYCAINLILVLLSVMTALHRPATAGSKC
jgi:hypothetical protein